MYKSNPWGIRAGSSITLQQTATHVALNALSKLSAYCKEHKMYLHCAARYQHFCSNAGSCHINLLCYHHRNLNGWEIHHFHAKLYKYVHFVQNLLDCILNSEHLPPSPLPGRRRVADEHCTGPSPTRNPTFLGATRMEFHRLPFPEVPTHYVKKSQQLSIR